MTPTPQTDAQRFADELEKMPGYDFNKVYCESAFALRRLDAVEQERGQLCADINAANRTIKQLMIERDQLRVQVDRLQTESEARRLALQDEMQQRNKERLQGGEPYGWFLSNGEFTQSETVALAHDFRGNKSIAVYTAQPAAPALTVWFGSMPESNGRENWTVTLRRKDKPESASKRELHHLMNGFTVCRSEYKDRMRYEADRLRFLIGESDVDPDILAYDADLHSGYVEQPAAPALVPLTMTEVADVGLVPNVIKPFTPAQRRRLWDNSKEHHKDAASFTGFERIVTLTERAHGIGPVGEEGRSE